MLMLVKVCVIPGSYGCYHRWWSHFPSMTRAFKSALGLISSSAIIFPSFYNHFSFLLDRLHYYTNMLFQFSTSYEPETKQMSKSKHASREQLDKTRSGPHPPALPGPFPVLEAERKHLLGIIFFYLSPFSPEHSHYQRQRSPPCLLLPPVAAPSLLLACDVTSPPPFPDPTLSSSP